MKFLALLDNLTQNARIGVSGERLLARMRIFRVTRIFRKKWLGSIFGSNDGFRGRNDKRLNWAINWYDGLGKQFFMGNIKILCSSLDSLGIFLSSAYSFAQSFLYLVLAMTFSVGSRFFLRGLAIIVK